MWTAMTEVVSAVNSEPIALRQSSSFFAVCLVTLISLLGILKGSAISVHLKRGRVK
jgi:hypothetical protein